MLSAGTILILTLHRVVLQTRVGQSGILPSMSLTSEDLEDIKAAVAAAEKNISGEIVPCVVDQSSAYEEVLWKAGACGALGAALFFAVLHFTHQGWIPLHMEWVMAFIGVGGLVTAAAANFSTPLKRLFVSNQRFQEATERLARVKFLQYEVFRTRHRTGILLFISLLERRAVILADAGINAKVDVSEWKKGVALMLEGCRRGDLLLALKNGIEFAARILKEKGFHAEADDINELSNDLRGRDDRD